eukprot:1155953-Pelagomonas_calceolata.AAC.3
MLVFKKEFKLLKNEWKRHSEADWCWDKQLVINGTGVIGFQGADGIGTVVATCHWHLHYWLSSLWAGCQNKQHVGIQFEGEGTSYHGICIFGFHALKRAGANKQQLGIHACDLKEKKCDTMVPAVNSCYWCKPC